MGLYEQNEKGGFRMTLKNNSITHSVVDLFCGIGGLSYGLKAAGLNVVAGLDINEKCKFSYGGNNGAEFIQSDLTQCSSERINQLFSDSEVKILVGCAPCQPFSRYSKRYRKQGFAYDKEGDNEDAKGRYYLIDEFLRIIKDVKPHIVSLENVPGLRNEEVFVRFTSELEAMDYQIRYSIVYCPDYGVPQKRKRLVLFASRFGDIELIKPTTAAENYITVWDAIGEVPELLDGAINESDIMHRSAKLSELNKKRIKQSRAGGTWRDWDEDLRLRCHLKDSGRTYPSVYGRMKWGEPSPTITTQFYGYGNGRFGHPEQDRALSLREGAILQSFPLEYKFIPEDSPLEFTMRELGMHIGNAVPPKLGEAVGKSILKHLEDVEYGKKENAI